MKTQNTPRDFELLKLIASGDREAFTEFYNKWHSVVISFLHKRTKDRSVVEDVVEDVFAVVWTAAVGFQGRSAPSSWLFGIAKHKLAYHFRKMSRRVESSMVPFDGDAHDYAQHRDIDAQIDARNFLTKLLENASPKDRERYRMIALQYNHTELAAVLGVSEETAKMQRWRLRQKVRKAS